MGSESGARYSGRHRVGCVGALYVGPALAGAVGAIPGHIVGRIKASRVRDRVPESFPSDAQYLAFFIFLGNYSAVF
jgi:hypothetical protein